MYPALWTPEGSPSYGHQGKNGLPSVNTDIQPHHNPRLYGPARPLMVEHKVLEGRRHSSHAVLKDGLPTLPQGMIQSSIEPKPVGLSDFAAQMICHILFSPLPLNPPYSAHDSRPISPISPIRTQPALSYSSNPSSSSSSYSSSTYLPQPTSEFRQFVAHVLKTTLVSHSVVIISLLYLWRVKHDHPDILDPMFLGKGCEYRMCTTAIVLANKVLDDNSYTLAAFSTVTGLTLKELNSMEVSMLKWLNHNLNIPLIDYQIWLNMLDGFMRARSITCPAASSSTSLLPVLSSKSNSQSHSSIESFHPVNSTQARSVPCIAGFDLTTRHSLSSTSMNANQSRTPAVAPVKNSHANTSKTAMTSRINSHTVARRTSRIKAIEQSSMMEMKTQSLRSSGSKRAKSDQDERSSVQSFEPEMKRLPGVFSLEPPLIQYRDSGYRSSVTTSVSPRSAYPGIVPSTSSVPSVAPSTYITSENPYLGYPVSSGDSGSQNLRFDSSVASIPMVSQDKDNDNNIPSLDRMTLHINDQQSTRNHQYTTQQEQESSSAMEPIWDSFQTWNPLLVTPYRYEPITGVAQQDLTYYTLAASPAAAEHKDTRKARPFVQNGHLQATHSHTHNQNPAQEFFYGSSSDLGNVSRCPPMYTSDLPPNHAHPLNNDFTTPCEYTLAPIQGHHFTTTQNTQSSHIPVITSSYPVMSDQYPPSSSSGQRFDNAGIPGYYYNPNQSAAYYLGDRHLLGTQSSRSSPVKARNFHLMSNMPY